MPPGTGLLSGAFPKGTGALFIDGKLSRCAGSAEIWERNKKRALDRLRFSGLKAADFCPPPGPQPIGSQCAEIEWLRRGAA